MPLDRLGDPDDWATDVFAVMDACSMDSAIMFAGVSGAQAAIAAAIRDPDRVDGLWLANAWRRIDRAVVDQLVDFLESRWGTGRFVAGSSPGFLHHDGKHCYHDDVIRTQISLTEDQMERLRRESARTGKSMAQLVRDAIDGVLADDEHEARIERIKAIAGKYRSGVPNLAERHDDYLAEDIYERKIRGNK